MPSTCRIEVIAVFGGQAVATQQSRLRQAAHVVVATVGRTLDLVNRGSLDLSSARYVVLDEADEMLDLGFIDDVERILRMCPSGRQTSLFSATIPPPIERLADRYMYDPVTIRVTPKQLTVDAIEQAFVEVPAREQGRPADRGPAGRGARAGDHLLPHEDRHGAAGRDAAGPRDRGQGPARRHEPGPARRGDALLQGPPAAAAGRPPTSPPAGSTSSTSRTSSTTTSPTRPRPTSTASAARAGSAEPGGRSPS